MYENKGAQEMHIDRSGDVYETTGVVRISCYLIDMYRVIRYFDPHRLK